MSVGSRIKELREERKLSRNELAQLLGVTVGAISNYENEVSSPKEPILFKLIETLGCDANYLFQDAIKMSEIKNDVTYPELQHIKKYRDLDSHGTEMVDMVLESEYKRVEKYGKVQEETVTSFPIRIYSYLNHIACAGNGFYFDDIPTDTIEVHVMPDTPDADFVIGVNGDSMEPTYSDKENVFVKKTTELSIGDIGIFIVNNALYIKELGENGLLSHNSKYKTIVDNGDGNIRIIGKVTGKVVENKQKY